MEQQTVRLTMNGIRGRWIEPQRLLERVAGAVKVSRPQSGPAERGVTAVKLLVGLNRAQRGGTGKLNGISRRGKTEQRMKSMRRRQLAPGQGKPRFDSNRHLELVDGGTNPFPGELLEVHCAKGVSVDRARVDRDQPVVNGGVSLYSDTDGTLSALVDFHLVTKWKTAGDSLLAARRLARPDSRNILIVGAGTVVTGSFVMVFDPIFQGLAISLMMGSLLSTILTVVVIPLAYYLYALVHGGAVAKPDGKAPESDTES